MGGGGCKVRSQALGEEPRKRPLYRRTIICREEGGFDAAICPRGRAEDQSSYGIGISMARTSVG